MLYITIGLFLLALGAGLFCPEAWSSSSSFAAVAPSFRVASLSGSGTSKDPYQITSLQDLQSLRLAVAGGQTYKGKYFLLKTDIDLPRDWEGIGTLKAGSSSADNGRNILPFSATFDGGGHSVISAEGGQPLFAYLREARVRNLKIGGSDINGSGLISHYVVDKGERGVRGMPIARVENVTILSGSSIQGSGICSGYAGMENTVDIINCTVEEHVVIGNRKDREKVGSFGGDFNGVIENCRSAATVYGTSYVGGIVGCRGNSMSQTSIKNCIFTGKVVASGSYAGGIAGGGYGGTGLGIHTAPNAPMLTIKNCLVTGQIQAANVAGGIEGFETSLQVWNNGIGYLQSNLFTGTVTTTGNPSVGTQVTSSGETIPGGCAGGIVGAFRGLDRYNKVQDNYYKDGCGSSRGIGNIVYVDTSSQTHETAYGVHYFDSSKEIPVYPGVNDTFKDNIQANHNRSDDPLGTHAQKLAKPVSDSELADGTVTAWLNAGQGSLSNWKQYENGVIEPKITYIPSEDVDLLPSDGSGSQGTPGSQDPSSGNGTGKSGGQEGSSSKKKAVKIKKGKCYLYKKNQYLVNKVATAKKKGTVTFIKAKNAKAVTVPATVQLADGRKYKVIKVDKNAFKGKKIRKITIGSNVTSLSASAFAGSPAGSLILKTEKLKKEKIKGCLKSSRIKKIYIRIGSKKKNKKILKAYKKIFTKKNTGKKSKLCL